MPAYEWDKDAIKSSITNHTKINSLMSEMNNENNDEVNDLINRSDNFTQFKLNFIGDYNLLKNIDENLLNYLCELYKKTNMLDLVYIRYPEKKFEDEQLISYIKEIYESLEDKEITREINEIIKPENHYLRILDKKDAKIGEMISGRTIKESKSNTAYSSLYKNNTFDDIMVLTHEIGHNLSHRLFWEHKNLLTEGFLSEVESYYMELLAANYLGSGNNELVASAVSSSSNRLSSTLLSAWNMHIQYLLDSYSYLNLNKVNETLQEEGYAYKIDMDAYKNIIKVPFFYRGQLVSSYMVALELFRLTLEDKEKGIDTYKNIFKSDIQSFSELLDKYNINFIEDYSAIDYMIQHSRQFKKILTKQE